ncbi:MAG TPA: lipase, partial [Kocuria sp.]|nr:lipase [Kocuria sp.]
MEIATPLCPAPAWLVPGDGDTARPEHTGTWAVMVHGRGAQRPECIRGARVAHQLGLHSLIVSYRNDSEAPTTEDNKYGLGFTEWEDVQAGIGYALEHGATDVVLFGWSMGGAIVLRTTELTRYRDRIRALVLTGPVVDWYELLAHQTRVHRIPRRVGRMAADLISHRMGPRITGLAAPLDLHALDWLSRWEDITTPTLILHSTDDEVVPVAGSVKLADLSPHVDFVGFSGARHTKEWNIDRKRYERSLGDWLGAVLRQDSGGA